MTSLSEKVSAIRMASINIDHTSTLITRYWNWMIRELEVTRYAQKEGKRLASFPKKVLTIGGSVLAARSTLHRELSKSALKSRSGSGH